MGVRGGMRGLKQAGRAAWRRQDGKEAEGAGAGSARNAGQAESGLAGKDGRNSGRWARHFIGSVRPVNSLP